MKGIRIKQYSNFEYSFNAVLVGQTNNLGDDIQTLAALSFCSSETDIDYVNKEKPIVDSRRNLICSGWLTHKPWNWPPVGIYTAFVTSVHLTPKLKDAKFLSRSSDEWFRHKPIISWLKKNEPVGARDKSTLQRLQDAGVDAYLSRCLTLTLQRPKVERENDLLVLIDIDKKLSNFLKINWNGKIFEYSHEINRKMDLKERLQLANESLEHLSRAKKVITTRLHAALPASVFGADVILLDNGSQDDKNRKSDFGDLVKLITDSDFELILKELISNDFQQFQDKSLTEARRIHELVISKIKLKNMKNVNQISKLSSMINYSAYTIQFLLGKI